MLKSRYIATREEVYAIPSPGYTDTWSPIAHGKLIDLVTSSLDSYGIKVWKSEFGLSRDKKRMFAVLDTQLGWGLYQKDLTLSVGLRNSIDKSLAIGVTLGNRVFVCDNLCFSGQVILTKKHLPDLEPTISRRLDRTIEEFIKKFQDTDLPLIALWKQTQISFEVGSEFICKLAEVGAIPINGILLCRKLWSNPKYVEFQAYNVWTLFNAITYYNRNLRGSADPVKLQEQSLLLWKCASTNDWKIAA